MLKGVIYEAVKDCWAGSHPDEVYEQQLMDDPALKKRSVLVPDDIKDSIRTWTKKMGLSGARRVKRRRRHI